jgi:hypothetical protein
MRSGGKCVRGWGRLRASQLRECAVLDWEQLEQTRSGREKALVEVEEWRRGKLLSYTSLQTASLTKRVREHFPSAATHI